MDFEGLTEEQESAATDLVLAIDTMLDGLFSPDDVRMLVEDYFAATEAE